MKKKKKKGQAGDDQDEKPRVEVRWVVLGLGRTSFAPVQLCARCGSVLEATQGQIHGLFSQHPYKCHQNRVAYVGD